MSSQLQKLADNRTPILLAELAAYLHLLGRFSEKHVRSKEEGSTEKYSYKDICKPGNEDFFCGTALGNILQDNTWAGLFNSFKISNPGELKSNRVESFKSYINKHTGTNLKGLRQILADAHGIVSGIEKELAGRNQSGRQKSGKSFMSTAFGYEMEIPLLTDPELKKNFFLQLEVLLRRIQSERFENDDNTSYQLYQDTMELFKCYYPLAIAETRRPLNEISLYDYVHSIAALLKSSLAKIVLEGWSEPRGKSRWHILSFNVDRIGLMSKGLKVGDILGYGEAVETAFAEIKNLVEFCYPLGNEIYRDATGIYFSFPAVSDSDSLINEIQQKIKDRKITLDYSLQYVISPKPSRSYIILGRQRETALNELAFPHVGDISTLLTDYNKSVKGASKEDICPNCRIRLKREKKDRCEACSERYQKRAEKWLNNAPYSRHTIWLDEVADRNGQVALLIGKFGLDAWLSDKMIGTFAAQLFETWKKENLDICGSLNITTPEDLKNQLEKMFDDPTGLSGKQNELCKKLLGVEVSNFEKDFWDPVAERDASGIAEGLTQKDQKADWLVRLLFRKHPSAARIRRIWETTYAFTQKNVFDTIIPGFYTGQPSARTGRDARLSFKIAPNPALSQGSTLDLELRGMRFSPVCVDETEALFCSTINLQILAKRDNIAADIAAYLNKHGQELRIKREDDKDWREGYVLKDAGEAPAKFQGYIPCIKIYDSPDQFMALVPAGDALTIAQRIYEEYCRQFSKVRDRLPLHLGVLAFHRRTPLYVAMDAAQRLGDAFQEKCDPIDAEIEQIEDQPDIPNNGKKRTIALKAVGLNAPLKWTISYATGDPDIGDDWHPYLRVDGGDPDRGDHSFDYTGKGHYVVHVKKLQKNDRIKIDKACLKLAYLENASDRFWVDEEIRFLDDIQRIDELWKEFQERLDKGRWSISQIYAFWRDELQRFKRDEDADLWEAHVKASLLNVLDISESNEGALFNKLLEAADDGLLDLCLRWHLQVGKIKPRRNLDVCQ
ncbi:MAG: hypothetical protein VR68_03620 [Peptococcaceae bacterium BRH_c4a]|nr:MAG: hypothetical protein VR68_03620 [Peptococcaceae bacterium BRH_c4a]